MNRRTGSSSGQDQSFAYTIAALIVVALIAVAGGRLRDGNADAGDMWAKATGWVTRHSSPTAGDARRALENTLTVKPEESLKAHAGLPAYSRDQYGPAWYDADRNGCDTRNDILDRDLADVTKSGACVVVKGTLHDPYTGRTVMFVRGQATSTAVQIDHIVPLAEAWQSGADRWTLVKRRGFANDPRNLLAVSGPENERKGDKDPAQYLPPDKAYDCTYAREYVQVKVDYGLSVDPAEFTALARLLAGC